MGTMIVRLIVSKQKAMLGRALLFWCPKSTKSTSSWPPMGAMLTHVYSWLGPLVHTFAYITIDGLYRNVRLIVIKKKAMLG